MSLRVAAIASLVLGVVLLIPFAEWWTLALGVLFLLGFIALGTLALTGPGAQEASEDVRDGVERA